MVKPLTAVEHLSPDRSGARDGEAPAEPGQPGMSARRKRRPLIRRYAQIGFPLILLAMLFGSAAGSIDQPATAPLLTRQQAKEDLDRLVEAVRYGWSYEEDKRLHFGVDLNELRQRALAELEDEVTRPRFALILRQFVAGMQDGHGWVRAPDAAPAPAKRWPFTVVDAVEGVLVDHIIDGLPDAPARGDELVAVDGAPLQVHIEAVAAGVFASTPGARRLLAMMHVVDTNEDEHAFEFRRPDGSTYALRLPTVDLPGPGPWGHWFRLPLGIEWRVIDTPDDGTAIGYLRIASFAAPDQAAWAEAPPERREEILAEVTDRIRGAFVELADTKGMILDLRHNFGGTDLLAQKVSDHLLTAGYVYFALQGREGPNNQWGIKHVQRPPAVAQITPYRGPLVVLIDEGTFSAADNLAACLADLHPNITFVGRPTGAGTGGPRELITLPHSGATIGACAQRVYRPNGQLTEGRGVIPDIPIRWSRHDFLGGCDPDIEAGLQHLRKKPT